MRLERFRGAAESPTCEAAALETADKVAVHKRGTLVVNLDGPVDGKALDVDVRCVRADDQGRGARMVFGRSKLGAHGVRVPHERD